MECDVSPEKNKPMDEIAFLNHTEIVNCTPETSFNLSESDLDNSIIKEGEKNIIKRLYKTCS